MSSIVTRIKSALWSRVALITDQEYRFDFSDGVLRCVQATAGDPAPLLILVGRSHCYELRSPIPDVDVSEAAKIADNMPVASPFGANIRRNRLVTTGEGNLAHITLVRQASLSEWLRRPLLLMPITWLIDRLVNEKPSVVALPGELVGIAPSKSGYQSRLLDGSEEGAADFWWSSGYSPDGVQSFDEDSVLSSLAAALSGLSWRDWVEAFWRPEVSPFERFKSMDWRSASYTVLIGVIIYLAATSLVLTSVSWVLDRQLANEPQAFADVLELRSEKNALLTKDRAWKTAIEKQYATWTVWPPLLAIWDGNTLVTGVEFSNGRAEVFLTADLGTDALMAFKESVFVKNADFGNPIRRNLRYERDTFSIAWDLTDPQGSPASSEEVSDEP